MKYVEKGEIGNGIRKFQPRLNACGEIRRYSIPVLLALIPFKCLIPTPLTRHFYLTCENLRHSVTFYIFSEFLFGLFLIPSTFRYLS